MQTKSKNLTKPKITKSNQFNRSFETKINVFWQLFHSLITHSAKSAPSPENFFDFRSINVDF